MLCSRSYTILVVDTSKAKHICQQWACMLAIFARSVTKFALYYFYVYIIMYIILI